MKSRLNRAKQAGFTLVEVIIAMAIFLTLIAGAFIAISRGYDLVSESRHYTRGSQILQSEIELLRTLPWDTFAELEDDELTDRFNKQIEAQFGAGTYTGLVETTTIGTDFVRLDVHLEWDNSSTGRPVTITYTTGFTDGGVNDYYLN